MKIIDARELFERRRLHASTERQKFMGRVALEGLAGKVPEAERATRLTALRRYAAAVRSSESLMAQVDELSSWATRLKSHSELLERETKALLRQLERSLRVESRLQVELSDDREPRR